MGKALAQPGQQRLSRGRRVRRGAVGEQGTGFNKVKGLLQRGGTDGLGATRCKPFAQPTGLRLESPESYTQPAECVDEPGGNRCRFHREHQQGTMGEVAVAEGLLKPFSPVGYLGFNGRQADMILRRHGGKLAKSPAPCAGQPDQVRPAKALQGEFAAGEGDAQVVGKVELFEAAHEGELRALGCSGPGKILAGIVAPELNEAGAPMSLGSQEFHSFYSGEFTQSWMAFNTFEEALRTV